MIDFRSIDNQNFYSLEQGVEPSQGQKFRSSQLVKHGATNEANDLRNQELFVGQVASEILRRGG